MHISSELIFFSLMIDYPMIAFFPPLPPLPPASARPDCQTSYYPASPAFLPGQYIMKWTLHPPNRLWTVWNRNFPSSPTPPTSLPGHYKMNLLRVQSPLDSTELKSFTRRGPPTYPPGQYIMKWTFPALPPLPLFPPPTLLSLRQPSSPQTVK